MRGEETKREKKETTDLNRESIPGYPIEVV